MNEETKKLRRKTVKETVTERWGNGGKERRDK